MEAHQRGALHSAISAIRGHQEPHDLDKNNNNEAEQQPQPAAASQEQQPHPETVTNSTPPSENHLMDHDDSPELQATCDHQTMVCQQQRSNNSTK